VIAYSIFRILNYDQTLVDHILIDQTSVEYILDNWRALVSHEKTFAQFGTALNTDISSLGIDAPCGLVLHNRSIILHS